VEVWRSRGYNDNSSEKLRVSQNMTGERDFFSGRKYWPLESAQDLGGCLGLEKSPRQC